jgi:hypothetical protein
MESHVFTVFKLFQLQQRYGVPLFQRPYVWTEKDQWQPLWTDIVIKANQVLNRTRNEKIGSHFFGAVVVSPIPPSIARVPAYDIIDGQQRLTTLQILLVALRHFLKAENFSNSDYDGELSNVTINNDSRVVSIDKYKIWPTIADRATFETIFSLSSPDALSKDGHSEEQYSQLLEDAYRFFYESIGKYAQFGHDNTAPDITEDVVDSDAARKRIEALFSAIKKHLEIVVIQLNDDDDPQTIFQTLNARGAPLLPSDLIRNFVLLEAAKENLDEEDVEALYNKYWLLYDEVVPNGINFWKAEEAQGRVRRQRIDLFIFYYLTLKTGREITLNHIFQEFHRWWKKELDSGNSVEDCLKGIRRYSTLYKQLVTFEQNSRLHIFMKRIRVMETATVYPVLLYLFGECNNQRGISGKAADEILADLESYLVRRMICGMPASNYNRNFLVVLQKLRGTEQVTPAIFRAILAEFEGSTSQWPGDETFNNAWRNFPLYKRLSSSRLRMVLEAIDLQLETGNQEQIHIQDDLTIEHLYPQSPTPNVWAELQNPDLVHAIGNLTLLTQVLNNSLSNGPFVEKRPEIAKQSRLRLNVYFQELDEQEIWGEQDILYRGEQLFEIARTLWPKPPFEPRMRLPKGRQAEIEVLCMSADEKGIGEPFRLLVDTAFRNGLYPQTNTNSITFSSPKNRTLALFTVWINSHLPEHLRIQLHSDHFTSFYSVSPEAVEHHLGKAGKGNVSIDEAIAFAHGVDALLASSSQ